VPASDASLFSRQPQYTKRMRPHCTQLCKTARVDTTEAGSAHVGSCIAVLGGDTTSALEIDFRRPLLSPARSRAAPRVCGAWRGGRRITRYCLRTLTVYRVSGRRSAVVDRSWQAPSSPADDNEAVRAALEVVLARSVRRQLRQVIADDGHPPPLGRECNAAHPDLRVPCQPRRAGRRQCRCHAPMPRF